MKLAVLYARKGQTEPSQWFQNGLGEDTLSPQFWNLMKLLGNEIDLTTWSGYMGDMGKQGTTYYTKWDNEVDCMDFTFCS